MADDRFPYEQSPWVPQDAELAERWVKALERTGAENVRARLAQSNFGSPASISIGTVPVLTVGFAQEWLAWHDSKKTTRESEFRAAQIFATRWAAGAATVAALAGAIGWAWTILHKP